MARKMALTRAELIAAGIEIPGSNSAESFIPTGSTVPTNGIYLPDTNTVAVATNGAQRITVDASGRLLVGTSSSSGVGSTLQVVGSECAQFHKGSADTAPATLSFSKSRNTSYGSFTSVQAEDRLGSIAFRGDDGTDYLTRAAEIVAFVDGTTGANVMPGRLVFSTTADGASSPTERLRITSDGLVGIGTSAPYAPLHVQGDINCTLSLSFGVPSGGSFLKSGSIENLSTTSRSIRINADPGNIGANSIIGFNVDGSEKLRITSDGQILIGRTSSSYTGDADLEVQKFAYSASGFGNFPYNNYGPIESITIVNGGSGYTDGSYTNIALRVNGFALGAFANFVVNGGSITSAIPITGGRSESIGAGNPMTLNDPSALGASGTGLALEVGSIRNAYFGVYANPARIRLGNSDTTVVADQELGSILFSNRDVGGAFAYGYAGDTARIYARAAGSSGGGYLDFWAANNSEMAASSMVIKRNGVGIGTQSPSAELHVNPGSGNAGNVRIDNGTGSSADGYLNVEVNSGGALYETVKTGGLAHVWYNTGAERMRIDTAGRLLVGTSSAVGNGNVQVANSVRLQSGAGSTQGVLRIVKYTLSTTTETILTIDVPAANQFIVIEGTFSGSRHGVGSGGGSGRVAKKTFVISRRSNAFDVVLTNGLGPNDFEATTSNVGGSAPKNVMNPTIARAGTEAATDPQKVIITVDSGANGVNGVVTAVFDVLTMGPTADIY